MVAIPIKRMQQTIADLATNDWLSSISLDRIGYIKNIIKSDERNISIFEDFEISH